jgi:drug/metabolite transporter (DMT)-like permease
MAAPARLAPQTLTDTQPYLGIALKVLSALAFTVMSAGIKTLSDRFPVGEIVFFRSLFAIAPLLVWLGWQGDLIASVRTSNLKGHLLRGIIGSCGMFAGFAGLSFLPLSDSIAIGYAAPLMVVVLAALVLRERVRGYRWGAVVVGFVGVLIMLLPHLDMRSFAQDGSSIGALFAIFAACCSACATIQVRRLTGTERVGAIVLYFSLLTTVLGLFSIVLGWRVPTLAEFGLFVVVGILGGIGQILLTQSYRFGDASLVAPFEYTTMIWSLLIGWFVFGQLPQPAVAVGGVIVAAAGIFVVWRERQLGLVRAKAAETGAQRPAGA